ncbi:hypothetical protein A3Q56_01170, partial [Intoshia linei]
MYKAYICEDKAYQITCQNIENKNQLYIFIKLAFYGRRNANVCKHLYNNVQQEIINYEQHGPCFTIAPVQYLMQRCNKNKTCFVEASTSLFGNPCINIKKYLYIEYYCIHKSNKIFSLTEIELRMDHYVKKQNTDNKESDKYILKCQSEYHLLNNVNKLTFWDKTNVGNFATSTCGLNGNKNNTVHRFCHLNTSWSNVYQIDNCYKSYKMVDIKDDLFIFNHLLTLNTLSPIKSTKSYNFNYTKQYLTDIMKMVNNIVDSKILYLWKLIEVKKRNQYVNNLFSSIKILLKPLKESTTYLSYRLPYIDFIQTTLLDSNFFHISQHCFDNFKHINKDLNKTTIIVLKSYRFAMPDSGKYRFDDYIYFIILNENSINLNIIYECVNLKSQSEKYNLQKPKLKAIWNNKGYWEVYINSKLTKMSNNWQIITFVSE